MRKENKCCIVIFLVTFLMVTSSCGLVGAGITFVPKNVRNSFDRASCNADWEEDSAVVGDTIHAHFTWSGAFYNPNQGFYATMSIWDPDNQLRASYTEQFESSGSHTLSVTADIAGTWRANIFVYTGFTTWITDDDYITVSPPPQLSYSPSTINFGTQDQGWTGSSTFEIWNSGGDTLSYTISESISWITVTPTSGTSTGEHDTITVSVVNTGGMVGYYSGYIYISSNGGSGSIFVDITINPSPDPILSYSPTEIHFGAHDQGWTGSSTFEIWNGGGGTLTYSISENLNWITVSPTSGSSTGEHDTITVNVLNTGSMSGYYSGSISISSNGGSGGIFVDITINSQQTADWTIMVYMDGDNNLYPYGVQNINQMEVAGSTNNVNIIVLFDGWNNGDTVLYRINHDPNGYNSQIISTVLDDQGAIIPSSNEVDMGDPQTLIHFGDWVRDDYPANNYCLILWDHGNGWKNDYKPVKSVCWDDTSGGDCLTTAELRGALSTITNNGNNPINLIGFDACLMQMIEVGYEIAHYCEYMTGSEETIPVSGWNYEATLTVLDGTPSMSPRALGAQFVSDYVNAGGDTLSTINLGLLDSLRSDVSNLGTILQSEAYREEIHVTLNSVQRYADQDYADLYHFAYLIQWYIHDNDEVDAAAHAVMNEVENVVTSENHNSGHSNSHGLSIYAPGSYYDQRYEDLLFAQDSQWDEFLSWYHGNSGNNSPPVKPQPPSGTASGKPGVEYTYTAVTTDPDGDTISYVFSWGDGTTSQTDFIPSGQQGSSTHSWAEKGNYEIKVKAVDVHGAESDWSDPLPISMPMDLPGSQSTQQSQNIPSSQQSNLLLQNLILILMHHQTADM
jgi:hypothetical protein